jgi:hypothetical protein
MRSPFANKFQGGSRHNEKFLMEVEDIYASNVEEKVITVIEEAIRRVDSLLNL